MRRILRKIAEDESRQLGDTSTLADPAVVDDLVQQPAEQAQGRVSARAKTRQEPSLTGPRHDPRW